jgi:lysophospholipase L1-like esterase
VKQEYNGKEPFFDIAEVESTTPDGNRESFPRNGHTYYSLASLYTDDGGHLNKTGRKKVSEQLLLLLVSLN